MIYLYGPTKTQLLQAQANGDTIEIQRTSDGEWVDPLVPIATLGGDESTPRWQYRIARTDLPADPGKLVVHPVRLQA